MTRFGGAGAFVLFCRWKTGNARHSGHTFGLPGKKPDPINALRDTGPKPLKEDYRYPPAINRRISRKVSRRVAPFPI